MSKCISREGEYSDHKLDNDGTRDRFYCRRCWVLDEDALIDEVERLTAAADRLAATVVLLAHDAHPVYGNTTGWRGGIGGQALTQGCSIIDPPPGDDWTQYDLPTGPARDWLRERYIDLDAIKAELKDEWMAQLQPKAKP